MPNRASVPHEFQPGEALTAASLNNVQGAILGELDDTKAAGQQSIEQLRTNTEKSVSDLSKSVDTRFADAGKARDTLVQRATALETAAGNMTKRADGLETRIGGLEGRAGQLENARTDLTNRLGNLEKADLINRMGKLEGTATAFATRLDDLDKRLKDVDTARQDLTNRMAVVERRVAVNFVQVLSQRTGSNVPVVNLDGNAGHITVPAFTFGGAFTVEAWIYARSAKTWSRIFDFGNGPGNQNILFAFRGNEGRLQLECYGSGASTGAVTATATMPLKQWVHVAATVDGAGNGVIYMNGQPGATGKMNPPESLKRTINYIGRSNWAPDQFLDCLMYGFSFWSGARSQAQIQADMYSGLVGSEGGLFFSYPMTEGSGGSVLDEGPNHLNGTMNGATWAGTSVPGIGIASQNFNTRGGNVLLFASGAGWGVNAQQIGMQISVDGQVRGYAKSFTNEASSHKVFVSGAMPLALAGGSHLLTLETWNSTRVDYNDFFDAWLIELPS